MAQTMLEGQWAAQQQPWGWQGKNTRHLLDLTTKVVRLLSQASLSSILLHFSNNPHPFRVLLQIGSDASMRRSGAHSQVHLWQQPGPELRVHAAAILQV